MGLLKLCFSNQGAGFGVQELQGASGVRSPFIVEPQNLLCKLSAHFSLSFSTI
jgi:hypothetical protein